MNTTLEPKHKVKFLPIPKLEQYQIDSFWEKVDIKSQDECWNWKKSLDSWGYGHVGFWDKLYKTNRVAWYLVNGDIPDGMVICHRCDNPKCCNPNHLFLGTFKDNTRDCVRKGRLPSRHGELNNSAKLTNELARQIKTEYEASERGHRYFAKKYNVSPSCILRLCSGISFKNL